MGKEPFRSSKAKKEGKKMILEVTSVFKWNGLIPIKFSCEGTDVNPPLNVVEIDEKAVSLAVVVEDPDAPSGTFVHWVAWNIKPGKVIPENLAVSDPEAIHGRNDFGKTGYNGPCPPKGHGIHHYHFLVYALDKTLDLKAGSSKKELEKAMKKHVVHEGELVGLYERR